MKTITLFILLLAGMVSLHAEEKSPVSNLEIGALVESVKLPDWAEVCKKSNFLSEKPKVTRVDKYGTAHASGALPIERDWEGIYGRDRWYEQGWEKERKTAEELLTRPCKDDQRKWLVNFLAACDAIKNKDPKAFQSLVVSLAEDYRTLL